MDKNCPHVAQSVKFLGRKPSSLVKNSVKRRACAVCEITEWPLICLYCGVVYCGRYGNQHAIKHWESNPEHCINLNCQTFEVYCYNCDSDILNDTKSCHIQRMIHFIQRCCDEEQGSNSDGGRSSDYSITNGDLSSTNVSTHQTPPVSRTLHPRSSNKSRQSNENEEQQNNRRETRKRRRSRNDSTSSTSSNVSKKVVGLKNLGNTCFMNAVLQSLSNIQEFSHFFKQLPAITEISTKQNGGGGRMQSLKDLNNHLMVEELRKVFICLTDHHLADNKSAISPEELFVVIWKVMPSRFGWFRQQDAHEFLRYTLDRVHNELVHLPDSVTIATEAKEEGGGGGKDTKPSIVTNIFGGALLSEVRCLTCTTLYKKIDPFLDLSLDIPDNISKKRNKDGDEKPFVEVEELAETEIYNCNNCKSKQSSTKKFWFKRLPNVLCLHLKRFRWTNANASWTKVDTMIDFPVSSLDMSAYILPEPSDPQTGRPSSKPSAPPGGHLDSNIYDLAAVIVHHGTGVHSGHYTAYAIHEAQWWHFDDSTVMPVDIPALKKCKPYILFYVRRVPEVTKK
ncbi:hypothetical protein M8J75_006594 [Diaphorina citri]|nr:hypothetical protein M8J75_006594 [Diaphorina citri]